MQTSYICFLLLINSFLTMAQPNDKNTDLQKILTKMVDNKKIFGTSFAIKKDGMVWQGASGNLAIDQPYFIASTTKLFTTALILRLRSEGKVNLEDKISKYLGKSIIDGLHIYKGKEYSESLTIRNLLAHTSGLPDYFQDKGTNGKSLENDLKNGSDQFWTFENSIERTKTLKAHFAPGTKAKAHYSDANFQLLGRIIEVVTGKSYSDNCNELIIKPLDLAKTYLYHNVEDTTPKSLYFKSKVLNIPKAMTSFGPDGGMVSTSSDLLTFIESFFTGKLFPKEYLNELYVWNKIFFPFRSGIGIHLFKLPWIFNPTGVVPYYIGHSGLSGALAYFSPEKNIYIVGTVNQVAHPDLSFKAMIKLTQVLVKNDKTKINQR
jgi:D-alanyl-D-alanine carboxypeptidase